MERLSWTIGDREGIAKIVWNGCIDGLDVYILIFFFWDFWKVWELIKYNKFIMWHIITR